MCLPFSEGSCTRVTRGRCKLTAPEGQSGDDRTVVERDSSIRGHGSHVDRRTDRLVRRKLLGCSFMSRRLVSCRSSTRPCLQLGDQPLLLAALGHLRSGDFPRAMTSVELLRLFQMIVERVGLMCGLNRHVFSHAYSMLDYHR